MAPGAEPPPELTSRQARRQGDGLLFTQRVTPVTSHEMTRQQLHVLGPRTDPQPETGDG